MSDPLMPDQPKTRRSEPLQPDSPGRGDTVEPVPGTDPAARRKQAEEAFEESAEQQKQQTQAALDNVRDGYGS